MEHTQEPWHVDRDCGDFDTLAIYDDAGNKIVFWGGHYNVPTSEGEANAHRIVACVNRLAGVEDVDTVEVVDQNEHTRLRNAEHLLLEAEVRHALSAPERELARLRRVEGAARAYHDAIRRSHYGPIVSAESEAVWVATAALSSALEAES